jgi:hypothetical protein
MTLLKWLTGFLFVVLLANPGAASVIPAASCQLSAVQAAVNLAVDGDTVTVPAGPTCIWAGTITINKGITLQGAGINQTKIEDRRPENPPGERWVIRAGGLSGTKVFRLTGFTFQGGGQTRLSDGFIQLSGCSTTHANYRIDHNKFSNIENNALRMYGSLYGLVDHNIAMILPGFHLANVNNQSWPRDGVNCTGDKGDGSWASPLAPGTIRAHYFEDNSITGYTTPQQGPLGSIIDNNFGARSVVRYNTLTHSTVNSHGTDSGQRNRGQRWLETYENTFSFPNNTPGQEYGIDSVNWFRGGSGVFFNNHVTIDNVRVGYNWVTKHLNLRSNDPNLRSFVPWYSSAHPGAPPDCDGTAPWDGNSGDASGKGYRCLDQPGAGTSIDFLDVEPPPKIPAQNTLEPIYVWNNTLNGVQNNCANGNGCASDGVVVAGRDIIFGTPRPGYTPLPYPHPLTIQSPPMLPGNLNVK